MKPRFLLTNDDGYDGEGLCVLREVLETIGSVIVVAPCKQHSGCGHQSTIGKPIHVRQESESAYVIDGTPADCIRIGLFEFGKNADWVIAGINYGGNLGIDAHVSGTVAAAREAALHGKPAIAISQYHCEPKIVWNDSAKMARLALSELLSRPIPATAFWNVNLPTTPIHGIIPDLQDCPCDNRPFEFRFEKSENHYTYKASYSDRPRTDGGDVDTCFNGRIAVSKISI